MILGIARALQHFLSIVRRAIVRRRLGGNFLRLKPLITEPALCRFFKEADLRALDVGARGGPLEELAVLGPFTRLFLVEPDAGEAEALGRTLESEKLWRSVVIIPEALGSAPGEARLNITRQPGLSSLLEPDRERLNTYYPPAGQKNFSLRDWEVTRQKQVTVISLDEVARRYHTGELAFIKLDTQGTELDILRSGKTLVLPGVVAVYVEAEFVGLYRGQTLFGELNQFLESFGFRLVDVKRSSARRQVVPRAAYSKRELLYAHALYFRDRTAEGGNLSVAQKRRLAALAVAFEYFDYAIYLAQELGADECANDIARYAVRVKHFVARGLDLHEQERFFAAASTDRSYER